MHDSEHERIPDWQWLTDILERFDIVEKYTMRKNAKDFTSLEANLYTEIQRRYTPRKSPHILTPSHGTRTSKELEEAKRIHAEPTETMHRMGYGLMLDGFTFYKYGYELEPWQFEMNFTMHHAYEIHNFVQTQFEPKDSKGVTE
jgi:hypothetical protein